MTLNARNLPIVLPQGPTAHPPQTEVDLLRAALECMPVGLSMFDGDDRLVLANQRYADIWVLPPDLARPGALFADIHAGMKGRETEASLAQPAPVRGSVGTRRREWRLDNGRTIEVVVSRRADGTTVAVHEDITEKRTNEARIVHLARHDALTGLSNRLVLREYLDREWPRTDRAETVALLCLDLDHFKDINDGFGHPAGDAVLVQVAERLVGCVRGSDLVARAGGDEFAIVQVGAAQPTASAALAQRVIEALSRPFLVDGREAFIGASVGVAIAPFDGASPDELTRHADLALYRAKAEGRSTLRYFEPAMNERAHARRHLEADLRHAVERGEFHLLYQPQVALDGHAVTGVEALLRWQHPTRGLVSPMDFIPLAEESGLIVDIGRWVLAQACRDARAWPASVGVAVNVSAVQFKHGALLGDVLEALAASGLAPERLEIEITETVLLQDTAQAVATLHELRRRGVRVAMDDFGTGYSSLGYLRSFPFDRIKIDRSFVCDVDTSADALAIVRAVAALGRSLGMAVTVEGVETVAQLEAVRREGCSDAQGFYFSRPRPASEIPALIVALPAARATPTTIGCAAAAI